MKIIVSEIPEEGMDLELSETFSLESVRTPSPLHAVLKIRSIGSEVLVDGSIEGDVELICSRCLNSYTMGVKSQINVVYEPAAMINREEHHRLRSDELDMGFYKNDTLDTDEVLVEQLLLSIPMKPLCSSDCKGICPKCGADLNVSGCNCGAAETDTRLKILEQLLKKKE
jgi:uncharacterized protein